MPILLTCIGFDDSKISMISDAERTARLKNLRLNRIKHVHLMGICGSGMSALAGLFFTQGVRVTGSDNSAYPPASTLLERMGIHVMNGYHPANLEVQPDLVVVGNVVRRSFPEAQALEQSGILYASLPECLAQYFLAGKRSIVVVGTHGKTTVSSMLAWILYDQGHNPGFMIGGIQENFGTNYRMGDGQCFVVEGDEYDTAYFDKRPKFLHYSPDVCIMTSCEFDHADIYTDLQQIETRFQELVMNIPQSGCLVACGEYPNVAAIAHRCPGQNILYGADDSLSWTLGHWHDCNDGLEIEINHNGSMIAKGVVPVMGRHNALNSLAAVAASAELGIDPGRALQSLTTFRSPARRQQVIPSSSSVVVIDDFAHHPTAVRETTNAVRRRYRDRRLVAVLEPRSNTSRRGIFQERYGESFFDADMVIIKEPSFRDNDPVSDRFSAQRLAETLQSRGLNALAFPTTDRILEFLMKDLKPHDVVLIMSNGSFDDLARRVAISIREA